MSSEPTPLPHAHAKAPTGIRIGLTPAVDPTLSKDLLRAHAASVAAIKLCGTTSPIISAFRSPYIRPITLDETAIGPEPGGYAPLANLVAEQQEVIEALQLALTSLTNLIDAGLGITTSVPAGNEPITYTFTQGVASAAWLITHNLGHWPSIAVMDSTGRLVEGEIQNLSPNQVIVSFSGAFAGIAYCT